ncbi:L-kynurenine/alpha-aminoadipate aminotransferase, putative [Talaromyces stipitatus ATCC 10500]|uniref:L-kynurenine/alpha-aminoadipate aminotransferase, putative n=1 Tax=Talaromyces stipitatus (strain ATCC 10500 / CBS 375.48 / QM 6759 / NRRL 1006) TaxID=441959 RepID=B8MI80_TALSN|nr:L-kynurenine/alpha-aminoadipate aminotransferase, putative [Talaromyces stipitatus ATCC 10500]EED14564.1 L-kynurenine/alpha-aminoadipate aminotransferase, putative [Talaromyces stipitatus ATCC 10500]
MSSTQSQQTIVVVGATGIQGSGVVRALLSDEYGGPWFVRALTQDPRSGKAQKLLSECQTTDNRLSLVSGHIYDETSLRSAFMGAHGVFAMTSERYPGKLITEEEELKPSRPLSIGEVLESNSNSSLRHQPLGIRIAAAKMDEQGLLSEDMYELLSNWDEKACSAAKPHLLYTVPSGQSPTGATQSAQRRQVYKVCQKYDIFIGEDEPYCFLQVEPYKAGVPPPSSCEEFLKVLLSSFLKVDVDGRVLRLESFSKVLSPGTRTGWIVGSEQIVERFAHHFESPERNTPATLREK